MSEAQKKLTRAERRLINRVMALGGTVQRDNMLAHWRTVDRLVEADLIVPEHAWRQFSITPKGKEAQRTGSHQA